jgi:hypothetical protein
MAQNLTPEENGEDTAHLRSTLAEAIDGAEASTKTPEPSPPESKVTPEKADGATPPEGTVTPEKGAPEASKPEAEKILTPRERWAEADKQMFGKLPKEAQDFVLRREHEIEAAYTKKTTEIATLKREFEPVQKMFEPYSAALKERGWTPHSVIEGWANVEKALLEGKGPTIIKGLVDGYKMDVQQVLQALGIRSAEQIPQPQGEQRAENGNGQQPKPEDDRIAKIEQRLALEDRARYENAARSTIQSIEDFKNAVDEKKNLRHPLFAEVEADMAKLAVATRQSGGKVPSLSDLYDQAVWANPSTREKLLAEKETAREQAQRDAAKAKAASARKAGSSITGGPGTGAAPSRKPSGGSVRDALLEAMEDAGT